jgi:LmbE family N-acetylglucosaminyl deacetylase
LSAFAQAQHAGWGNPKDAIATRQAEDQAAMAVLGVDYLRLNFTDCIYRGHPDQGQWFYNNDDELFGQVHPEDMFLAGKIVEALIELVPAGENTLLYAPLGVGHHVDHQLAHAAAWQLNRQGWKIAFYEDYPYADPYSRFAAQGRDYASLTATLTARQKANLQPRLCVFSEADLQAKIDSISAYASQVEVLFGSKIQMENNLRRYALFVGQGSLAERIWVPG